MIVQELWRHPVKSLQGERLAQAAFDRAGLAGDRLWGIRESTSGTILTGRREPLLLLASARLVGDEPELTLPDGSVVAALGVEMDAALSAWLGRPVELVAAADVRRGVSEFYRDATDDTSDLLSFKMPPGRFVDLRPLLLLTTPSLRRAERLHAGGDWHVRRFRPNILIEADGDDWLEDAWTGRRVSIGPIEVDVVAPCVRCTMVTRRQPGLDGDLDVYRTLLREHSGTLGVWADVAVGGAVRVGDPVDAPVLEAG
jgi:uncharacterized protein YcbX